MECIYCFFIFLTNTHNSTIPQILKSILFWRSGFAVGLSAISLLDSVFSSLKKNEVHSPKSEVRNRFAKDAAAIPNASETSGPRLLNFFYREPKEHRLMDLVRIIFPLMLQYGGEKGYIKQKSPS